MLEQIDRQQWDFIAEIQARCSKYIKHDARYGFTGSAEATNADLLDRYMALMYKFATDAKICQHLRITQSVASLAELETAICLWIHAHYVCGFNTTDDGLHLFYTSLGFEEPQWHPLPAAFREKWLDFVVKQDADLESYMSNFVAGMYQAKKN